MNEDNAELLDQVQLIKLSPRFRDLAVNNTMDADPQRRHLLACGWDA